MLIGEQRNTRSITFIDTEIEPNKGKIIDIGAIKDDGNYFHSASIVEFVQFVKASNYICGHNVLNHDIKYINRAINDANINFSNVIDTLYLSPLLFPTKPYHALLKDDKLQTEDANNPLNDSKKARDLFHSEVAAFWQIDEVLKEIFYLLLHSSTEFGAFFRFINFNTFNTDLEVLIRLKFHGAICEHSDLTKIIL